MGVLVLLATFLCLVATAWSVLLLFHCRDWRMSFLTALCLVLPLHLYLDLALSYYPAEETNLLVGVPLTVNGLLAILAVGYLGKLLGDREQMTSSLRESEQKYRKLIETTKTGYLILDGEGRVIDANEEYVRLTGHTSMEEIRHRSVLEWTATHDQQRNREEVARCMERGYVHGLEIDYADSLGKITPLEINGSVMDTSNGKRILGLCRDITARKKVEERLRASEAQARLQLAELNQIYRFAPVGLGLYDRDLRFLRVNDQLATMNGQPADRHLGRTIRDVIPLLANRLEGIVRQVFESEQAVLDVEIHGFSPAEPGSERDWVASYYPLLNEDGTVQAVSAVVQDVTIRKQIEVQLRQHAERLEVMSRRVVQVQEEERRHLARELHDQMGQLLTVVNLCLQRARIEAAPALQARLDECLGVLGESIGKVRNLSLDLRPAALDVLGLEAALRSLVERQSQRCGYHGEFISHLESMRLPADLEITCYRVVQEALTNVARHAQASRVQVELRQDDSELRLTIQDDGVGFDPRPSADTSGEHAGLLGMKERVQLLHGRFALSSAIGRGTRIEASFPLAWPTAPTSSGESKSP